jgi:hypothetical protein
MDRGLGKAISGLNRPIPRLSCNGVLRDMDVDGLGLDSPLRWTPVVRTHGSLLREWEIGTYDAIGSRHYDSSSTRRRARVSMASIAR